MDCRDVWILVTLFSLTTGSTFQNSCPVMDKVPPSTSSTYFKQMEIHIYNDSNDFSSAVADWIVELIRVTLVSSTRFTIALSGGNTPKALYELLAATPRKEKIEWRKMHIFWGDERDVDFADPRNNARMAFDSLLNHVDVPREQIHVMRTDIPPEQSAGEYEKMLKEYFSGAAAGQIGSRSFDLVLLGMGDDGHTLSLFPGTEVIHEENRWATSFFLTSQNMYRITLTKTIVNLAGTVAFLSTGPAKAHALKEVLKGAYHPDLYPSQVIHPVSGELHWFVDQTAASLL